MMRFTPVQCILKRSGKPAEAPATLTWRSVKRARAPGPAQPSAESRVCNPKGIVSFSPELSTLRSRLEVGFTLGAAATEEERGTSYPGSTVGWNSTPTGLCHVSAVWPEPLWGWLSLAAFPKVARSESDWPASQPWAVRRNPFGIRLCAAAAVLVFLLATFARAQDSQFYFDPNGNLFVQTGATTAPPQIVGQPQNRMVAPGDSASFFVVAKDTRSLIYEWRFNGVPLGGSATNDAVLLQNVSTNNEGEYRVVLTNPSGSVTSAPALLIIDSDADGVPDSWELAQFGSLTNSASTDADGDGSSNLQEYLDDTNPADTNSVLRHLTLVRDGGSVALDPQPSTSSTLNQFSYTNGQTVTVTAINVSGDEPFHAWLGEIVTRSNSITLVMTNNKTLHARFTPIVFIWTNSASGDWNGAANWVPNLAPGSNDSIVIPNNAIVTLNTPAVCADVTLGSAGSIPTLTGSGTLRVRSSFLWQSGTMGGTGRTVIDSGATMVVVSSSAVTLHTRALENGGTVLWTGAGNFNLVFNAVITNRAGALIQVQNAASLGGGIDFGRLDNVGTFRKSGNAGTTTFSSGMSLNNTGTVDIQTGTLNLSFGGTQSGGFNVPGGSALILSGGTFTAGGSSSITGAGQLIVSGGTANLAGLVNISGSNTFSSGVANLTGNYICTNNALTISGGTVNLSGTGLVSPAFMTLSSGALAGTSTVTVNSTMNWGSGEMTGSGRTIIAAGATLNVANPAQVLVRARTLENGGTVVWTGAGNIALLNGAVITNRTGALFHAQRSGGFGANGNENGRIDNAGAFRKSTHAGTTATGGISFNNYGSVDLQTGTLGLGGGGTQTGSITILAGATLALGGTHNGSAGSSITGAGQLLVNGGTANLAGLVNVSGSNTFSGGVANLTGNYICTNNTLIISGATANFNGTGLVSPSVVNFTSGTLGGTSPVTVLNAMTWTDGVMNGNGRTIIAAGATLSIANPGIVQLNPRTLENGGTVLWTGAGNIASFGGSVITNRAGALFHAQNAASFGWPGGGDNGRFDNAGTFRKSANSGTTTLGSGSVVAFNNSGTVDIRSGILQANGSYTSSPGALLNCALGGPTPGVGYGRLQVSGAVTLNGALRVEFNNGFSPTANDAFTVLTAGTRNGTFASFSYPSNVSDMVMSNTANSVVVRALGPYFATTTLPDAMRNVGYTQQVTAVMNSTPIFYSVISGALPDGLNLSTGGLISGIPTVFGNSIFTIQASNAAGATIQQAFQLRVRNLPPEGLISWWRAENNALDFIGTNHGVLTNGATFAVGNVGETFTLDGVNDYVHVPDSPNLRPASLTLEAWAMFNSQNGPVFTKPFGPATGDSFALYLLSGTLHGFIHDTNANGVLVSSPSTLTTGQWHHVAFTFDDATKEQALYVNGVRVATSQSNRSIGYDNKPVLLGQDINNGNFDFPLNGRIDEASIYNRALSSNEIAAIFLAGSAGKPLNAPYFLTSAQLPDAAQLVGYTQQVSAVLGSSPITFSAPSGGLPSGLSLSSAGTIGGVPLVAGTNTFVLRATDSLGAFSDQLTTLRVIAPVPAPSGLISWWRGEGNALDSAGTNHGTASNGVVYVEGKVGQGFGFDGINDFVWVPDAANLRPTSITLEAWARFNGTQGPVLGRSWGAGIHNSYVIWQLTGNINGTIGDTNQAADILTVPFAPVSGRWCHVAFTFDDVSNQQALYLDGALVASGQSFRSIGYDNHPVVIGGDIDNGTVSFLLNGGVDEAAIYNRALTASEIAGIYNAGVAGKQFSSAIPRPQMLSPELVGANIKLTWTAVSNATYRLEFNPDLNISNWNPIPGDVTAVTNTASKLDALTPSNRLYRVRVVP